MQEDFINVLEREGFVFKCGAMGDENLPMEQIIKWNAKKLRENFEMGFTEHFSNDYKQIYWDYHDFSEVRFFILNSVDEDTFKIYIIISESDFIEYDKGKAIYDSIISEDLIRLASKIWECKYIDSIQTELEGAEGTASLEEMKKGAMPSVEPLILNRQ